MPTGFRDTWYDCKKAGHVCQQVSGIHGMAARRLVMYTKRFPGYMIWLQEGQSCLPTVSRSTRNGCEKASHASKQVPGIHGIAARS